MAYEPYRGERAFFQALGLGRDHRTYHCDSCHQDEAEGYGLVEVELDGVVYNVCCQVLHDYGAWT